MDRVMTPSELRDRYAGRFERWIRARLPPEVAAHIDAARLVEDAIDRVAVDLDRLPNETATLARLRDELRTQLEAHLRPFAPGDTRQPATIELVGVPGRPASAVVERYDASLRRLSEQDRQALILRLELGLGWEDVAGLLGAPTVASARFTVGRALARLAREMAK